MSNLPEVLKEEILSRIPVTSLRTVRSTCKNWNVFSKHHLIGNAASKQFLGLMLIDYKVCSLSFNLQGIHKDDFVVPTINQVNIPNHMVVGKIFHCDGLLLCVIEDNSSLVVWNPYLGQMKWIEVSNDSDREEDMYALGYDNNNKRNHKILRIVTDFEYSNGLRYEIFRFNSNSWSFLDVEPNWNVWSDQCDSVSLNGNTYFLVQGNAYGDEEDEDIEDYENDEEESGNFLICFDFTKESFGPRLLLPFNPDVGETVTLSCVRDEQLALLYQSFKAIESIEIWVTNKIDPNAVSWSKFLKVDITPLSGFPVNVNAESFFIDEEMKVAVVFDLHSQYQKAHIIGNDGCIKSVNMGRAPDVGNSYPLRFSSYVPSLVQLQINQPTGQQER